MIDYCLKNSMKFSDTLGIMKRCDEQWRMREDRSSREDSMMMMMMKTLASSVGMMILGSRIRVDN